MSDEFRIDDELNSVESALAGLKPRKSTIDRDRLLYLAGQSSPSETPPTSRRWLWPAATVLSTSAAVLFSVLYFTSNRSVAAPNVRIVYLSPASQSPAPAVAQKPKTIKRNDPGFIAELPPGNAGHFRTESTMLRSRHPILTTDIERLPLAASSGSTNSTSPQSLHEMRVSLAAEWKTETDQPTKKTPGLRLLQWAWPSQQGDRL